MRVLGVNDDRDCCDCCGRQGLKKVVWLETAAGEVVAYGTGCAARALGLEGTPAEKRVAIAELARKVLVTERRRVFKEECRRVRGVFIPRDFSLARTRKKFAEDNGPERAVQLTFAAAVAERIRRWPVTK